MSGQSPTGVQTPGQRVLVNVLPLFLIFFLILTGHVSSGFEFTAHFDPALFLVPVFFLALYGQRTMTPVIIMILGLFKDIVDGTPIGFGVCSLPSSFSPRKASSKSWRGPVSAGDGWVIPAFVR